MELATTGKKIYPGYKLPLWHNPREVFSQEFNTGTRFRIAFVENGTGILRLAEHHVTFIAPTLFCLSELDQPELEQSLDLQAQALYFHPSIINGALTFEIARGAGYGLSAFTDSQDLYWLRPFVQRNAEYNGQLRLGPVTTRRISVLIDTVSREIALQRDNSWPCRSRSFFLELLFLLNRVYEAPYETEEVVLTEPSGDASSVILYLHLHYQEKITIEKLTRAFHTNRTTLSEQFRETTGISVIAYLIQLRVRLAALMLRDTELSISEVMTRVGFNDSTHFGRTFRKHLGCAPSEYRQRNCWMLHYPGGRAGA